MDLRHDLELSIGNYLKKILAEVLSKWEERLSY